MSLQLLESLFEFLFDLVGLSQVQGNWEIVFVFLDSAIFKVQCHIYFRQILAKHDNDSTYTKLITNVRSLPALISFLATLDPIPPVAPVIITLFPLNDFMYVRQV